MHEVQSARLSEVGSLPGADSFAVLEIKAFGRLQICCNGQVVTTFPTRKAEELIAYLFLNPGIPQSRDRLIEILWPGAPAGSGRSRLSTALWRVRVLLKDLDLDPDYILETDYEYVLLIPHHQPRFDVTSFLDHIASAEVASTNDVKESYLLAAQGLYVGDLLEGIYSDWCLIERERLARLYLRALGQLATFSMDRGAYKESIETCQRILEIDPLREEVHRALMVCYSEIGHRCDGIRQFQRCANSLLSELGVFPLPETIEVYRSLIAAAKDECLEPEVDPLFQAQLQEAFSEFISLGDDLVDLIYGGRQPE